MVITVDRLVRHFRVHRRAPGLRSSLRGLVRREYVDVPAVDGVSFHIAEGEIVGFLGPNGAGKTTTLKCLSGLLHPTSGSVRVLGRTPHERERAYLRAITLVMGQRSSLFWDLPALDAFAVNQAIYGIPPAEFEQSLDELVDLLGLQPLLAKPVRTLSLGERMRCELAGSLLHRPRVLFLDEPTLGLDVNGQLAIRDFLRRYNEQTGATVLLTSHYMGDVTALARRVLVIDHGVLRFDGDLSSLVQTHAPYRIVQVRLASLTDSGRLAAYAPVQSVDGAIVTLRVPREQTAELASRLLADLPIEDLSIEDPPVDDVIRSVFAGA